MEDYRYSEYLRGQISEIDALGADNVFGSSGIREIKAYALRSQTIERVFADTKKARDTLHSPSRAARYYRLG